MAEKHIFLFRERVREGFRQYGVLKINGAKARLSKYGQVPYPLTNTSIFWIKYSSKVIFIYMYNYNQYKNSLIIIYKNNFHIYYIGCMYIIYNLCLIVYIFYFIIKVHIYMCKFNNNINIES